MKKEGYSIIENPFLSIKNSLKFVNSISAGVRASTQSMKKIPTSSF